MKWSVLILTFIKSWNSNKNLKKLSKKWSKKRIFKKIWTKRTQIKSKTIFSFDETWLKIQIHFLIRRQFLDHLIHQKHLEWKRKKLVLVNKFQNTNLLKLQLKFEINKIQCQSLRIVITQIILINWSKSWKKKKKSKGLKFKIGKLPSQISLLKF